MRRVTIIDYGNGNANSIKTALGAMAECTYSHRPEDVDSAELIILPGVGHLGAAMASLRQRELVPALRRAAFERRAPILGICLGMQLMTQSSEEGDTEGLGWLRATTRRMRPTMPYRFKVPHVGWTLVTPTQESTLLRGIDLENDPFYFCHAYSVSSVEGGARLSSFTYDRDYVASFELGNLFGVQFHPEKSQEAGHRLLTNFLALGG